MKAVPASRYFLFGAIACAGCALDLWTKSWIFDSLGMPGQRPSRWLIGEIFGFTTSLNEGALFGIGQGSLVTLLFNVLVTCGWPITSSKREGLYFLAETIKFSI
jgi:signal peptidase II